MLLLNMFLGADFQYFIKQFIKHLFYKKIHLYLKRYEQKKASKYYK